MPKRTKISRRGEQDAGSEPPTDPSEERPGSGEARPADAVDAEANRPSRTRAPLDAYRNKRSAERTPEPFGGTSADRPRIFVVQKHRARRLHYDLRLEIQGTLKSWAVPRGPSFDPAEKRMAVFVEDHPVEYADFEGLIPDGNYGAGAMIVWDRGTWVPIEDADHGLEKGKILFDLHGYKLRGRWTLVRTKGNPKDWLLIKKPDAYALPAQPPGEESILSGLLVEELAEGKNHLERVRQRLEAAGALQRKVRAVDQSPMLAETADAPFSKKGWLFELKYDGYRLLACRDGARATLTYRRGTESTRVFPDLARALLKLPVSSVLLDGEVVVLDDASRPSFQRLQRRVQLSRTSDIERAAVEAPATYYVFDLLAFEDYDLRPLPLEQRKSILRELLPKQGPIRYSDHIETRGEAFFREVEKLGLEGIVAKRADSPYRSGRSSDWLKMRVDRTGDFVVVGYTESTKVGRPGFGALHLAYYDAGRLVYTGRAGTGFDARLLVELGAELQEKRIAKPRAVGPLPPGRGHVWVEPEIVVEVRYREITDEGLLRHPVFLRLRPDKSPEDCGPPPREHAPLEPAHAPPPDGHVEHDAPEREGEEQEGEEQEDEEQEDDEQEDQAAADDPPPTGREASSGQRPRVVFSNLNKVFWPAERYTKGDLIDYYRRVSPWLLPYLADRPLVLTRFPDGIEGKSFFQKDAPPFIPGWVRTERMWSEHAAREIDYFIADDLETLLYVINMGSIPLHVWSSRMSALANPDWCIIDLDPKKAPFSSVIRLALRIRALTEAIELPSFIKTSGATGLHVLLPLGRRLTYEQSRTLGELISRVIVEEEPEIATIVRPVGSRGTRVYLDFLQNGHGRLLVSPLCVRPLPGAPVSMPLAWSEVDEHLDPSTFTIRTAVERLEAVGEDPLRPVLSAAPDLARALSRLGERLTRPKR